MCTGMQLRFRGVEGDFTAIPGSLPVCLLAAGIGKHTTEAICAVAGTLHVLDVATVLPCWMLLIVAVV